MQSSDIPHYATDTANLRRKSDHSRCPRATLSRSQGKRAQPPDTTDCRFCPLVFSSRKISTLSTSWESHGLARAEAFSELAKDVKCGLGRTPKWSGKFPSRNFNVHSEDKNPVAD